MWTLGSVPFKICNKNISLYCFSIILNLIKYKILGVLMILAGSLEFEKGHNNEIQERPSDNIELPEVSGLVQKFFYCKNNQGRVLYSPQNVTALFGVV